MVVFVENDKLGVKVFCTAFKIGAVLQIGPEPNITEVVGAIISFCASLVGVDLRTILAFSKTEGTNTRAEGFCGFKALISLSATRHHTAVVRTEAKVGYDLSTIGVSCSIIVGTEGCYFEVSVAKTGPSPVDVKISVIAVTIDNETVFSTICLTIIHNGYTLAKVIISLIFKDSRFHVFAIHLVDEVIKILFQV